MTILAFEQFSESQKLKVLLSHGRVISEKKDSVNRCFLYYLGSFYAAVKYSSKTDDLVGIEAFERIGRKERLEWKILRFLPNLN